jgi:hypothetical protein
MKSMINSNQKKTVIVYLDEEEEDDLKKQQEIFSKHSRKVQSLAKIHS